MADITEQDGKWHDQPEGGSDPFSQGYKHRNGKPVSDACGENRHAECAQTFDKCACTWRGDHTVLHAYMSPAVFSEMKRAEPAVKALGTCYWLTTPHEKDSHGEDGACVRWCEVTPENPLGEPAVKAGTTPDTCAHCGVYRWNHNGAFTHAFMERAQPAGPAEGEREALLTKLLKETLDYIPKGFALNKEIRAALRSEEEK